eukprot:gnl/TRDRNA2_/TRDRNA2_37344_c0_seq2.p1 gnl/TRDRNA2_/TRDRNA2_37344_c0~~gnl/TRDRNA2_/TRDRNA2_37344_c0_seq2.p1  ORF type:complete len:242 (-),score=42.98 gnl/TRDRNA2_/TRDRNA2_37344_c0_seq2:41-676(-)
MSHAALLLLTVVSTAQALHEVLRLAEDGVLGNEIQADADCRSDALALLQTSMAIKRAEEPPAVANTTDALNSDANATDAVALPEAQAPATPGAAKAPASKGPAKATAPGVVAPFGKESTAHELQQHAARTQDTLVDALENAEVAEIKRSIFRSLTRLRAAEIKEFDTIARLETQAIDEYNDHHHYRKENPLEYLHADEPKVPEDKFSSFHK